MTALELAKEICNKAVVGTPMRAEFLLQALAALVVEIEAAPVAKVRGKVGELATIHVSHSLVGQGVHILALGEAPQAAATASRNASGADPA